MNVGALSRGGYSSAVAVSHGGWGPAASAHVANANAANNSTKKNAFIANARRRHCIEPHAGEIALTDLGSKNIPSEAVDLTRFSAPKRSARSSDDELHFKRERLADLDLVHRGKIEEGALRILAYQERHFIDKRIWRNRKIVWRRHALEDAARQVVFGSMTVTEISARPSRIDTTWTGSESRYASQMGADTDDNKIFRVERTRPVCGIRRLLQLH